MFALEVNYIVLKVLGYGAWMDIVIYWSFTTVLGNSDPILPSSHCLHAKSLILHNRWALASTCWALVFLIGIGREYNESSFPCS